ncbi:MAG: hypothetical protein KIS78_13290 [Labilithrix sp.]|nr:hypothetical protein [Labilithrix sp.]
MKLELGEISDEDCAHRQEVLAGMREIRARRAADGGQSPDRRGRCGDDVPAESVEANLDRESADG